MFVDAHVHLSRLAAPDVALERARAADVLCIAMTESPIDFETWAPVLERRRGVRLALGAHPLRAAALDDDELNRFDALAGEVGFVGEVGLDGSLAGRETLAAQRRVFERVLAATASRRPVLSVHSRGAEAEVIAALGGADARGVLHWYSGALRHVDDALDAGLYFSVNVAMLAGRGGLRVLRALPRDRVLTESDGPFASTRRRPSDPTTIPALVKQIAAVWGCEADEAEACIWANLRALVERATLAERAPQLFHPG